MKREIDTTKPHSGRVYDCFLDGTQNFEADRQAASAILKMAPSAGTHARLNRWFLQLVASRWAEEAHTQVLDLGSGLPTQGHFNEQLASARILFSDHDPLSVEYGQEILKDSPNMRYVLADLREPSGLLASATEFFTESRKLAVGFIGISYFLSDQDVRRLMQLLYDFAAPGSVLGMSYFARSQVTQQVQDVIALYEKLMKIRLNFRTQAEVTELLSPWRIVEHRRLAELLDVQHLVEQGDSSFQDVEATGVFAVRD
jgi:O-methyltransferase involved in polyketide biosynthesis